MGRRLAISLPEFLRTGDCGSLRRGATRAQILSTYGPPSEEGARRGGRKSLYCFYGSIELGFDTTTDRVTYVQVENTDWRGRYRGFRGITLRSSGFIPKAADAPTFRRFARRHGIRLIPVLPPWRDPETVCFATGAGVVAWFSKDLDTGETWLQTLMTEDTSRFIAQGAPGVGLRSIRNRHPSPSGLKTGASASWSRSR